MAIVPLNVARPQPDTLVMPWANNTAAGLAASFFLNSGIDSDFSHGPRPGGNIGAWLRGNHVGGGQGNQGSRNGKTWNLRWLFLGKSQWRRYGETLSADIEHRHGFDRDGLSRGGNPPVDTKSMPQQQRFP